MRGVDGALRAWSFAHILYAQRVAELTYACTERTKVVDSVASLHVASAGAHVPQRLPGSNYAEERRRSRLCGTTAAIKAKRAALRSDKCFALSTLQ